MKLLKLITHILINPRFDTLKFFFVNSRYKQQNIEERLQGHWTP